MMTMAVITSCEHKPLYLRNLKKQPVNIVFDWSDLHDGDEKPQGMTLYIYNDMTDEYLKYDVSTQDDTVSVAAYNGSSHVELYNSDMQAVLAQNVEDWNEHSLIALLPNTSIEPVYGGLHNADIDETAEGDQPQTITIKPTCLNQHIVATIKGVERVPEAESWKSTVSGIATSRKVAYLTPGTESKTVTPVMDMYLSQEVVKGEMRTFGTYTIDKNKTHKFIVYAVVPNGIIRYFLFDVTEKVRTQSQNHYIYLDGLDLNDAIELQPGDEDYPGSSTGENGSMSPSVDNFGEGGEESIKL